MTTTEHLGENAIKNGQSMRQGNHQGRAAFNLPYPAPNSKLKQNEMQDYWPIGSQNKFLPNSAWCQQDCTGQPGKPPLGTTTRPCCAGVIHAPARGGAARLGQ